MVGGNAKTHAPLARIKHQRLFVEPSLLTYMIPRESQELNRAGAGRRVQVLQWTRIDQPACCLRREFEINTDDVLDTHKINQNLVHLPTPTTRPDHEMTCMRGRTWQFVLGNAEKIN